MLMFDWVNLILGIIIVVLILTLLIKLSPEKKKQFSTERLTSFTATIETADVVKTINKHDRVRFVKINRRDLKVKERRYRPGKLGISDISKAIKKDYGAILNRRSRKHYEKKYGIPFLAYRGF